MFEVAEITTYRGYRRLKEGQVEVEVTIHDHGVDAGQTRYFVTAHRVDEPKKVAAGNGGSSISTALSVLHWYDLD